MLSAQIRSPDKCVSYGTFIYFRLSLEKGLNPSVIVSCNSTSLISTEALALLLLDCSKPPYALFACPALVDCALKVIGSAIGDQTAEVRQSHIWQSYIYGLYYYG